jgi:hypothetical protein
LARHKASLLEESARLLGAVLEPAGRVHRPYSIGSPVVLHSERVWLRVRTFLEREMNSNAWRGTADAAAIPGMSKPALLHRIEWEASAPVPVPVSAEVLTLITDPPASCERYLRTDPDLSDDWFRDLAASLAALRAYPTDRRFPVHDAEKYRDLLSATYGIPVPAGFAPTFATEHTDLTWANITAPYFASSISSSGHRPAAQARRVPRRRQLRGRAAPPRNIGVRTVRVSGIHGSISGRVRSTADG